MSSKILADRDINASSLTGTSNIDADCNSDVKTMEYHRQVLQSKIQQNHTGLIGLLCRGKQTYISPSDTIMSPCTAKLSAYRSKQVGKAKPKSLFAKTSTKNLSSGNLFGPQIPTASDGNEDMKMED